VFLFDIFVVGGSGGGGGVVVVSTAVIFILAAAVVLVVATTAVAVLLLLFLSLLRWFNLLRFISDRFVYQATYCALSLIGLYIKP